MSSALTKGPRAELAVLPAAYEQAITALATCESIDECKSWADKASALASYARQAEDDVLFSHVLRIRARALRRCGELLKAFQSPGGRPAKTRAAADPSFTQRQAAEQAGMSKRQEKTAVRVADVPTKVFEAAVESEHPPTVTKLATMGTTPVHRTEPRRAASHGMQLVRAAIVILGKIKSNDFERKQAFDYLRSWLDARET